MTATPREWLEQLYGTAERGWLTIFSANRTTGGNTTDWAPVGDIDTAVAAVAKREPSSCVWFGVATRRERLGGGLRGGDKDCLAIPALWLDIDVKGPGHADNDGNADTYDDAHQLIEKFPLKPTVVIDSGGGLQAWWVFQEMLAAEDAVRELLAAWGTTWARYGKEVGITPDNVFDVARVMRLPGTTNRKVGVVRPVTIIEADWTRRYGTDDIKQHLDPSKPLGGTGSSPWSAAPYIGPERPGDAYNARHTCGEVLAQGGFTPAPATGADAHWWRPGKGHPETTSATVYAEDGHATIWSETCRAQFPGLELRRPYDPFGLYAALQHGGSIGDAARALSEQGYGESRPSSTTVGTEPAAPLNLPAEWWTRRKVLTEISDAAHARGVSRDAVVGSVLARVSFVTPHMYRLPAVVGALGSLNQMSAIIGYPGTGKTTSKNVAMELIPLRDDPDVVDDVPPGSGEGLVEGFFEMVSEEIDGKTVKVHRQTKQAIFIYADEGEAMTEQAKRKGATLFSVLRTAWSGGVLGQLNASTETKRIIPAHRYRLAAVVGFQPSKAVALLEDVAGGTPQRYTWHSATDPSIPATRSRHKVRPLAWQPPVRVTMPYELHVADTIYDRLWDEHIAVQHGETRLDGLDAHGNLVHLKVAALLAILDERLDVTEEDWDLAAAIMATSRAVRASIQAVAQAQQHVAEQNSIGRQIRRETATADAAETRALERAAMGAARHVHTKAQDAEHPTCTRRCLQQNMNRDYRKHVTIDEAIDHAIAQGWIRQAGDHLLPGSTRPA